jgi:hypothetical protein
MADQEKDKQTQTRTDDILDSLLANYSSAEPRPGLETRILANLRDAEGRESGRGWWGFKWLWAAAAVAALIVASVLISGKRHVAPPSHTVVQTVQPVQQGVVQQPSVQQPIVEPPRVQGSVPTVGATAGIHHRHKTLAPGQQNATLAWSQRPPVFPTPTPLSEQERLLLSYYRRTPREEVIAQSHPDEPPVVGDQDQTEAIPDLLHIPQKVSNTR